MELQEESPILVLREKKIDYVVFGIRVYVESGLRLLGSVECGLPGSVECGLPGSVESGLLGSVKSGFLGSVKSGFLGFRRRVQAASGFDLVVERLGKSSGYKIR